MHWYSFTTK